MCIKFSMSLYCLDYCKLSLCTSGSESMFSFSSAKFGRKSQVGIFRMCDLFGCFLPFCYKSTLSHHLRATLALFSWETRVYCSETKLGLEDRLINNMIHFLEFLKMSLGKHTSVRFISLLIPVQN